MAFHIRLRIALCISQVLGFLQGIFKGFPLFVHLGQDKVGGSV